MRRFLALALVVACVAGPRWAAGADDLLEPEQAFQLSARPLDPNAIEVRFRIAAGYYMYRAKFKFAVAGADATLGAPEFPRGLIKQDEFFGEVETYRKQVAIRVPVTGGAEQFRLEVTSQGCADIGVCYPPLTQRADIRRAAFSTGGTATAAPAVEPGASARAAPPSGGREVRNGPAIVGDEARFEQAFAAGNLVLTLAIFFGAGILLAFTPCVLPMVPILSGIIAGEGRAGARAHAFALSAAYVLGMAATYTVIGVLAALGGSLLSATLQNAWVLGAFALVFVALALSMFGFYDLQLPAALHAKASAASARLKGGRLGAVALMGALSAAIVSPCVAAPLAGALLYISQTRDVALGGGALFALALGMGVPLMAVGVAEGALLPRSGHWMRAVKQFFGVLLLGVAVWVVSPVIPAVAQMLAWAALLIVSAVYLHALDPLPAEASGYARLWKGIGVIALLAGAALVVGALAGARDPLQPLAGFRAAANATGGSADVRFEPVRTLGELETRLAQTNRPVMLDFYADWCVSCKEMARFTFADPNVRSTLANMTLLQADVTANSSEDQQLLKRFRLFGPPGIIFFDAAGREIPGLRVIGFQPAERFLETLARARQP